VASAVGVAPVAGVTRWAQATGSRAPSDAARRTGAAAGSADAAAFPSLDAAMRRHIEAALARTHGRVEGPTGAAKLLVINPHTLRARMRKLGIDVRSFRVL